MGTTLFSMGEWAHNQASFLTNRNVPQMQRNTESAHIYTKAWNEEKTGQLMV